MELQSRKRTSDNVIHPVLEMRKLRPTTESDLPNITQSGSGERTFLLAFKRNHCSPGGLASVATDAALLRALNGGEARGQSMLSFSPPLKCADHQCIILKNVLQTYFLVKIKTYISTVSLNFSTFKKVSVLANTNVSFHGFMIYNSSLL